MIAAEGDSSKRLSDREFKQELTTVVPQLRAFARSLAGDRESADDLVQDTMLKGWSARERFEAGTHFKAWTFTILRNHFFSQSRRQKFVGEWDDLTADKILAAPASQDQTVELRNLMRALRQLPEPQYEALILVAAGGISYEEAAEITGAAVGTVKSRVARARFALTAIFESGILSVNRDNFAENDDPVASIFSSLEGLQAARTSKCSSVISSIAA